MTKKYSYLQKILLHLLKFFHRGSCLAIAQFASTQTKLQRDLFDRPVEIVVLLLSDDVNIWSLLLLKYGLKYVCPHWKLAEEKDCYVGNRICWSFRNLSFLRRRNRQQYCLITWNNIMNRNNMQEKSFIKVYYVWHGFVLEHDSP